MGGRPHLWQTFQRLRGRQLSLTAPTTPDWTGRAATGPGRHPPFDSHRRKAGGGLGHGSEIRSTKGEGRG